MEIVFVAAIVYVLWFSLQFGGSFNEKPKEKTPDEKLGEALVKAIEEVKKKVDRTS